MTGQGQQESELPSGQQIVLVANMTQQLWLVMKGKAHGHGYSKPLLTLGRLQRQIVVSSVEITRLELAIIHSNLIPKSSSDSTTTSCNFRFCNCLSQLPFRQVQAAAHKENVNTISIKLFERG